MGCLGRLGGIVEGDEGRGVVDVGLVSINLRKVGEI